MPDKRLILGFLLIMLTSVIAGLRQCQEMRLKQQPISQPWKESRAERPDKSTDLVNVGPSPAAVETKSSTGGARRKAPLAFDKTLYDAVATIAQAVAGTIASGCLISYVLLLRLGNRPLLAGIVNPGVSWFVAIPCNAVGGVGLVLLLHNRARNLPLALTLLIPAAIALYGTALLLWVRKRRARG